MAQKTKSYLYNLWIRGYKPLQQDFVDFFDSFWHKDESIPQAKVTNLVADLNSKLTSIDELEYFGLSNTVIATIGFTGIIIDTIDASHQLTGIPKVFINGVKYNVGVDATPSNNQCFSSRCDYGTNIVTNRTI